jgi:hypothetical protein
MCILLDSLMIINEMNMYYGKVHMISMDNVSMNAIDGSGSVGLNRN